MGHIKQRRDEGRAKSDCALYGRAPHHKSNDAAARLALLPRPAADAGIQPGDSDIEDRYQDHQGNLVAMIAVVPRVSAKEGRKKIEHDCTIPARAIPASQAARHGRWCYHYQTTLDYRG